MKITSSNGFTLIELAIVLIITGYLMGFIVIPLSIQNEQRNIDSTQKTLEEIKEALLGFAVSEGRLPCADRDADGKEDYPCDTDATKTEGDLPWDDLGIGKYDVWRQPFRYRVDKEYASDTDIFKGELTTDESKKLKVRNLHGISWTTEEEYPSSIETVKLSRVIAIIFSKGKNQKADDGNVTTDENDATYVRDGSVYMDKEPIDHPDNFDDILIWLSKNTLMNRVGTTGKWPPDY